MGKPDFSESIKEGNTIQNYKAKIIVLFLVGRESMDHFNIVTLKDYLHEVTFHCQLQAHIAGPRLRFVSFHIQQNGPICYK